MQLSSISASVTGDRIYKKKEYDPNDQQRLKKKEDRKAQQVSNPEGFSLGKQFDQAVAECNPSVEKIQGLVSQLRQADAGPSTKHLERAISYVRIDHLFSIVEMILGAGAKPVATSLQKAERRKAELQETSQREECDKVIRRLNALLLEQTGAAKV